MTHTQSIINLTRIIRKHESSHVIKVLLVVLLSSLCPDALSALPAHCWSFTERALIYAAAWLLTYCLYVQSWLIMKSWRGTEMKEWKSGESMESTSTVMKYVFKAETQATLWFDELRRSAIWLKLCTTLWNANLLKSQSPSVSLEMLELLILCNILFVGYNMYVTFIPCVASKYSISRVILFTKVLILFSHVH